MVYAPDGHGRRYAALAVNAQQTDQFALEMQQRAQVDLAVIQVAQSPQQQIEQFRRRMLRLRDQLDQLDKIGRQLRSPMKGSISTTSRSACRSLLRLAA